MTGPLDNLDNAAEPIDHPLAPAPADDHRLAHDLATRAGELLLELRAEPASSAAERWELRDDGDIGSHHFLVDELREARPDDRVLSEEGAEDRRRLDAHRVWIVDPLDGTREFGELGRVRLGRARRARDRRPARRRAPWRCRRMGITLSTADAAGRSRRALDGAAPHAS